MKSAYAEDTKTWLNRLDITGVTLTQEETKPEVYMNSPEIALKIMILSLRIFQDRWRTHEDGMDISRRPDILGTLYNMGYPSSYPRKNPLPGGSTLPFIFKGQRLENYSFGAKVGMVWEDKEYLAKYLP